MAIFVGNLMVFLPVEFPSKLLSIVYCKLANDYSLTLALIISSKETIIKALAEIEYMGYINQKGRDIHISERVALIQMQFQSSGD
jgi:hypothetical protein